MKLTIRNKLIIVFMLMASGGFLSWLISYQFIRITKTHLTEIRNEKLKNLLISDESQSDFENYINNAVVAVSTKEIQVLEENKIRLEKIQKNIIELKKSDPDYENFGKLIPILDEIHQTSMEFVTQLTGKKSITGAFGKSLQKNNEKIETVKTALTELKGKAQSDFDETVENLNRDSNQFAITGALILALIIGFVILSSLFLLQTVIKRIERLKTHFSTTSIDSLEPISDTGEDELGDLLKVSNKMLMNIKEARSDLIEKDFVENIINTINDLLIVCDNDWKVIRLNGAARRFFLEKKDPVYGKRIFEIFNLNDPERGLSVEGMKQSLLENRVLNTHAVMLDKNNEIMYIDISAAAMKKSQNQSGNSYVFIIRNITDQVANEKEKVTLQAHLAQSSKLASLGTLGAGVAHELNNPLAAVMGYAELIHRSKEIPAKIQEFASTILKSCDRMRKIINELLKFSRDTSLQDYEPVSIQDPIQGILIFIQQRLHRLGVTVKMDLMKEGDLILGDHNQIESVILNFFTNSCDSFTEVKDERKKEISIKTVRENEFLTIYFQDNAMGIPAEKIKNVFDPFFTTKPVGTGTGLGLFIVHQIIKKHKGTIEITSEEGKGTIFKLQFPILETPPDISQDPASSTQPI